MPPPQAKPQPHGKPDAPAPEGPTKTPHVDHVEPPAAPAPKPDLAALEALHLKAKAEVVRTEAEFHAALADGGFTSRRKKVASVGGKLYQAGPPGKVVVVSAG